MKNNCQKDEKLKEMGNAEFWENFKELNDRFGAEEIKLCKKHGFAASLEGWNYCPYCGEEMCG